MSYQYKGKPVAAVAPLISVEQERRRNAEIALALRQLAVDRKRLEAEAEAVRTVLTVLRSTVDRTRDETTRIAAIRSAIRQMPAPIHGGRDGLLAATIEMQDYERKKRPPRQRKTTHGTAQRYYQWKCRCETCTAWAIKQSAINAERYRRRTQRKKEAA